MWMWCIFVKTPCKNVVIWGENVPNKLFKIVYFQICACLKYLQAVENTRGLHVYTTVLVFIANLLAENCTC